MQSLVNTGVLTKGQGQVWVILKSTGDGMELNVFFKLKRLITLRSTSKCSLA